MQTITLYKYIQNDSTVYSPVAPEEGVTFETLYRLIADEGKELVNTSGERATCIDTSTPEEWSEVEAVEPEEEAQPEEEMNNE